MNNKETTTKETQKKDYKPIAKELGDRLAKTVADYFKEHPCDDVDEVAFHIDNIKPSIEFGKWHPYSDGCITLWSWNIQNENTKYGRTELITYC